MHAAVNFHSRMVSDINDTLRLISFSTCSVLSQIRPQIRKNCLRQWDLLSQSIYLHTDNAVYAQPCTEQLLCFLFGIRIWPRIPDCRPSCDGKGTLQAGIWPVRCSGLNRDKLFILPFIISYTPYRMPFTDVRKVLLITTWISSCFFFSKCVSLSPACDHGGKPAAALFQV